MRRIRVKPYECKLSQAGIHNGAYLVWATHPDCPNTSGNARGRVIHLERVDDKFDYPATYCGMLAVEYTAIQDRRVCFQCVKINEREHPILIEPETVKN